MHDNLKIGGRICFSAFPAEYDEAILRELCNMTLAERMHEALHVHEVENIITLNGHAQIATILGTSGSTTPFAYYFGYGSTPIISVSSADTSVPGEFYRQIRSNWIIVGTQIDMQNVLASGNGNGTWTSIGLFGGAGVSGTLGSGVLMTHALANYVKSGTNTLIVDYLINAQ